jgi:hypothetical protein
MGGGVAGERRGACLGLRFFSSEMLRFLVPSITETKEERALIMAFCGPRASLFIQSGRLQYTQLTEYQVVVAIEEDILIHLRRFDILDT